MRGCESQGGKPEGGRVWFLVPAMGLGELCKLPLQGPEQSPRKLEFGAT